MRKFLLAVLAVVFSFSPFAAGGAGRAAAGWGRPALHHRVLLQVQWGHQQEFLDLFLKNHYPLLKRIEATGRIASREDRVAGLSHDRRRALGLSRDDSLSRIRRWRRRRIRTKKR